MYTEICFFYFLDCTGPEEVVCGRRERGRRLGGDFWARPVLADGVDAAGVVHVFGPLPAQMNAIGKLNLTL